MANTEHLRILGEGVEVWNQWRATRAGTTSVDLIEAELSQAMLDNANLCLAKLDRANLDGASLNKADLHNAWLGEATLRGAHLSGANLILANLNGASLYDVDLTDAKLDEANAIGTDFGGACLRRARLRYAILNGANLNRSDLSGADLTGAHVYGVSAWDVDTSGAVQHDLVITGEDSPRFTIDQIELAQFIHLMLNNARLRDALDTLSTKAVLILGRFTSERKAVLDAVRHDLRRSNFLPVLFDFDQPVNRDLHETITTLARISRFVIADISEPKSVPQELVSIVEQMPSLPIQPILQLGEEPWAMFDHIRRYPWVLPIHRYEDVENLLETLHEKVILPATMSVREGDRQK